MGTKDIEEYEALVEAELVAEQAAQERAAREKALLDTQEFTAEWNRVWELVKGDIPEVLHPYVALPDPMLDPSNRFQHNWYNFAIDFRVPGHEILSARFQTLSTGDYRLLKWETPYLRMSWNEDFKDDSGEPYIVDVIPCSDMAPKFKPEQVGRALLWCRDLYRTTRLEIAQQAATESERWRQLNQPARDAKLSPESPATFEVSAAQFELLKALEAVLDEHRGNDW